MTIILSTHHKSPEAAIEQLRLLATQPIYEPLPDARKVRVRWALPADKEPQGGVDIQVNGDTSLRTLAARACGSFLGDWRLVYIADETCEAINPVEWRHNLNHASRAKTAIIIILDEQPAAAQPVYLSTAELRALPPKTLLRATDQDEDDVLGYVNSVDGADGCLVHMADPLHMPARVLGDECGYALFAPDHGGKYRLATAEEAAMHAKAVELATGEEPGRSLASPSPYRSARKQMDLLVMGACPALRPSHPPCTADQLAYVYVDDECPQRAVVVGWDEGGWWAARAGNPPALRLRVSTHEELADELATMLAED
jgi:hypothetical protein